jgi:hypothetical protein
VAPSKTLRKIAAAASFARIVAINVVAMAIAAMAAVHVYYRGKTPRPAPMVREILAAHPAPASAASGASGAAPTIEIDMEPVGAATDGAQRGPASPGVNDAIRR